MRNQLEVSNAYAHNKVTAGKQLQLFTVVAIPKNRLTHRICFTNVWATNEGKALIAAQEHCHLAMDGDDRYHPTSVAPTLSCCVVSF